MIKKKFDDPANKEAYPDPEDIIFPAVKGQKIYNPDAYTENRYKQTNLIKVRPKGWLIMDSWNNKVFPMDIFSVDTMKFDTPKLNKWFHQKYGGSPRDLFMPWHWTVELVSGQPVVVQTRPTMYKSGIPGYANHLTIMIIGDGNQDLYPGLFYKMMAHMIINPWKFIPSVRMSNQKDSFTFWTGKNFNKDYLFKEII